MAKERAEEPKDAGGAKVLAAKRPKAAAAAPAPTPPVAVAVRVAPPKPPAERVARDIGIDVPRPGKACEDVHCPFHGTLPVRGQAFEGRVVSTHMQRTVVVERESTHYIQKYERYEKRTKRMRVHSPPCLELKDGDRVLLMECRPIAKTVSFVAIQNRGVAA